MVKIENTYSVIPFLLIILAFPIMAINAVLFFFGIYIPILFLYLGLVIPFSIFLYAPFIMLTCHFGKKYMSQYPESPRFRDNTNHHSIILLNSEFIDDTLPCGLSVLVKAFLKKKCNFKIYNCYNVNDVKEVLKNKYASDIWIFGHGWRGGLGFKSKRTLKERIYHKNKGECLEYIQINKTINEYPKKRFIAQLHCNNKKSKKCNTSLPEILLIEPSDYLNSFVSSFVMDPFSIYCILKFKLIKRIKNTS